MMDFELAARIIEIVCAIGALAISIIALFKSNEASIIQQKVAELDERLKAYEVEKIECEKIANNTSNIEARAIELGRDRYRIRICNTGKARAYNIDYEVTDDDVQYLFQKEKTPFEFLDAYDSYDETVLHHDGFPPIVRVVTSWENENGEQFTRDNLLSF